MKDTKGTWHLSARHCPGLDPGMRKSKQLVRPSVRWAAKPEWELVLDDSNVTFPEFGISVVVMKGVSPCV